MSYLVDLGQSIYYHSIVLLPIITKMSSLAPSVGFLGVRDIVRDVGRVRIILFIHHNSGFTIRILQLLPPTEPEQPAEVDLLDDFEENDEGA